MPRWAGTDYRYEKRISGDANRRKGFPRRATQNAPVRQLRRKAKEEMLARFARGNPTVSKAEKR